LFEKPNLKRMVRVETSDELERGREYYMRQAWADAYAALRAADRRHPLEPEDLMRVAMSAYLMGRDEDSVEILTRAHHESLNRGDAPFAARCAFWAGFQLINKGDMAQAGGWFARAQRALEDEEHDCVEHGYLLIPSGVRSLFGGDPAAAHAIFERAAEIGRRFGDRDLVTLAGFGQGQALIRMDNPREGIAIHDEVMVAVAGGEVSAIVVGLVYCGVIAACQDVFDLRRAQEWTAALSHWCAAQPDLVPYRGQCLVHRAEILQLRGEWSDARDEAERARDRLLSSPERVAVGMAFYQLGELHRLRGEFADAENAFREASQWGRSPHPGLAKLRLAQGQTDAAVAAICREVDEARNRVMRSKILSAHVEIMLAANDATAARASADELAVIAAHFHAPFLSAVAADAKGAVFLADGDARSALGALRDACAVWQELGAPYEAARTRVLIGLACRALGDEDTAQMELAGARRTFEQLGAVPDLNRVGDLGPPVPPGSAAGLTGREVEVLELVATGKTNREIASALVISDKTVARHVSNIFLKLGVSSRAAATAYAYEHDLV